jgi:hypothetical protein
MFDVIAVTEPALIDAVFEGIAPENQPDLAALYQRATPARMATR